MCAFLIKITALIYNIIVDSMGELSIDVCKHFHNLSTLNNQIFGIDLHLLYTSIIIKMATVFSCFNL